MGSTKVSDSMIRRSGATGLADGAQCGAQPRFAPLMTFEARVRPELAIPRAAKDSKLSICYFSGGRFKGPRLRGKVLPGGGDWAFCRHPDSIDIDVRAVLQTDDQALIYLTYSGMWRAASGLIPKAIARGGERSFRPEDHYLRVMGRFETAARRYRWLNDVLAVGIGSRIRTGIRYEFFELL